MATAPRTAKAAAGERPAVPERPKRFRRNPELEAALGMRIRTARVAARMSQGALATAIGVSYQQMQKYELGKDRVAASTLQGIAAALGVHPGSFFDDSVSVPVGTVPDVREALRSADILGQIRNPHVLKQLVALAKTVVEVQGERDEVATHTTDPDEADRGGW